MPLTQEQIDKIFAKFDQSSRQLQQLTIIELVVHLIAEENKLARLLEVLTNGVRHDVSFADSLRQVARDNAWKDWLLEKSNDIERVVTDVCRKREEQR